MTRQQQKRLFQSFSPQVPLARHTPRRVCNGLDALLALSTTVAFAIPNLTRTLHVRPRVCLPVHPQVLFSPTSHRVVFPSDARCSRRHCVTNIMRHSIQFGSYGLT